ncbi:proteasome core particle subunit beta 2 [Claviceps pazoutovae]|uniref:proteasome endopeptidase complex n=1 Tax=Claviceps pazoutovae TaxID=1649127 RepID=A0A9P7MEA4_9HYPO|nr:proteasome core particle subunit beta 2 [Claviceps pazoutovae]
MSRAGAASGSRLPTQHCHRHHNGASSQLLDLEGSFEPRHPATIVSTPHCQTKRKPRLRRLYPSSSFVLAYRYSRRSTRLVIIANGRPATPTIDDDDDSPALTMPGFDFSNYNRNVALHAQGIPLPKATSTGTTIVGCLFDGGVVIAADTRATSGPIVADKNCEKLHYISPQIWCAGAGTAADTEFTTALISSQLELHSLSTGRKPRVVTCMTLLKQHLFRYQGHIGAYLVVAGCDPTGTHLFTVHAHGSTDKLPYVTMGSGSLAAMSVFETQWTPNLTQEGAVKLCSEAILSGIFNDLGSGSNVDVAIITKDKTTLKRNFIKPNEKSAKLQSYLYPKGTTAVLNEKIIKKNEIGRYVSVEEVPMEGEKMDVDL